MGRVAFFAGSFDPFTLGHQDIVVRACQLFDEVVVGVGVNAEKRTMFPLEARMRMIVAATAGLGRVRVVSYQGFTFEAAQAHGARFLVRGLRTARDFDYENELAQTNRMLAQELETVFLAARKEHLNISSTVVRDLLRHGLDAHEFLPEGIDVGRYV